MVKGAQLPRDARRALELAIVACLAACAVLSTCAARAMGAAEPSAADAEFFDKRVRPLLAEHCYACHSARKSEANLRLDVAAGWLRGGDSGPAVVPGMPSESLLVHAVRRDGTATEMPPDENDKLPAEAIRVLEDWVARGAPAGPSGAGLRDAGAPAAASRHWAYQPLRRPPLDDGDRDGSQHSIDQFVTARLASAGLHPSPTADRATLVRRLYFDLWGLPPDVDDLASMAQELTVAEYEALVDRLLASPRFAEHFARHWLDVVRFAESLTLRGFILPEAWRYRDYVIDTFHEDRPFDQFVREQLAGDLLPGADLADRRRQLIATTFLALGDTNLEEQDKRQLDMDVVDEQLDVIGKALLGQTIGCARCHDHKFDPIPTRDYYALAGILRNVQTLAHANVSKWMEVPLPLPPDEEARFARYDDELAEIDARIDLARSKVAEMAGARAARTGTAAVPVASLPGIVVDDRQARQVGQWQKSRHGKPYIGSGYVHDQNQGQGEKTLTFVPELPRNGRYEMRFAYTSGSNRASNASLTVFSADGEKALLIDLRKRPPIDGHFVSLGTYHCERDGQTFVLLSNEGADGHVVADAVQFLPSDEQAQQLDAATSPDKAAPDAAAHDDTVSAAKAARRTLQELEQAAERLRASTPKRPQAMTVVERPQIEDAPLHLGGSVHRLADVVPRGFLEVVPPRRAAPLPAGVSGRRELADWITSPDNPLTARVIANRVWQWLMGHGLVRTVDNFGTTGEAPSHSELLDHLAVSLVSNGWSVKGLVREIVLSQTYRQSSADREEGRRIDPENRLLWRSARRRLEAECLRDAMLQIGGRLQNEVGGSTIRPGTTAAYGYVDRQTRRSIYVPALRSALDEMLTVFDVADPSLVVGQRNTSTVAPQALFLLNSPFVREQAEAAARRLLAADCCDDRQRLARAFWLTLGRAPTPAESETVVEILQAADPAAAREQIWSEVLHLLFASMDFRYRD